MEDQGIEREICRETLGTTTGFLKFFQPTPQFIEWVKRVAGKRQVYDVGAGAGHVTKALLEAGIATVALDAHRHMQPEHPVLIADGCAYDYDKGSIVPEPRTVCHRRYRACPRMRRV